MQGGLFISMDQDKQKIFANMSLSIDGKEIATYVLQDFAGVSTVQISFFFAIFYSFEILILLHSKRPKLHRY